MCQIVRNFMLADPDGCRVLICDRHAKWSEAARVRLEDAGIRVVRTPYRAPNANAYAERFVRAIKEECLNRLIPLGERHHDGPSWNSSRIICGRSYRTQGFVSSRQRIGRRMPTPMPNGSSARSRRNV